MKTLEDLIAEAIDARRVLRDGEAMVDRTEIGSRSWQIALNVCIQNDRDYWDAMNALRNRIGRI